MLLDDVPPAGRWPCHFETMPAADSETDEGWNGKARHSHILIFLFRVGEA